MSATVIAAWIGALTGMTGLLWDFVKWKASKKPKLDVTAHAGMAVVPSTEPNAKYISIRVRNIGDAKTTLNAITLEIYESWWAKKRARMSHGGVINIPSTTQPLPFKVDTGEEWIGLVQQTADVEEMLATDKLWCGVYHSFSKKGVLAKVTRTMKLKPVGKPVIK